MDTTNIPARITVADINTTINHEPRILDTRLAEALQFDRPRDIRKLVERHRSALEQLGEVCATVAQTSKRGGRPGQEFWLNQRQALYLCSKSETPNAIEITIHMVDVFHQVVTGQAAIPGTNDDRLADFYSRVHGELVEYRGFVGKEVGGIRGAVLHYVKEYVVGPLTGLRQYLDDRFMAIRERDKMLLGHAADTTAEVREARREVGAVLTLARRSLDPEAFIRREWCDMSDIYRLAGVGPRIPRRNSLSATLSRSLDTFCKKEGRQLDARQWRTADRDTNYWRKQTVALWLRSSGGAIIKSHMAKYSPSEQGVIPFHRPEGR